MVLDLVFPSVFSFGKWEDGRGTKGGRSDDKRGTVVGGKEDEAKPLPSSTPVVLV